MEPESKPFEITFSARTFFRVVLTIVTLAVLVDSKITEYNDTSELKTVTSKLNYLREDYSKTAEALRECNTKLYPQK